MGYIDTRQEIIATIKEQTDIVKIIGEHVELKRSGVRYLGLCPFHGEKTPSFSVNGAQQFFYCFGCGESGDVFSFLMKFHNLEFQEALQQLADRLNIELPKKRVSEQEKKQEAIRQSMYAVTAKAAKIYRRYLIEESDADAARRYLKNRGIPQEVQAKFEIGYAPAKEAVGWDFLERKLSSEEAKIAEQVGLLVKGERGGRYDRFRDRVLFPIHDTRGRICGFGGRIVGEGQPKYMNSPESYIFNKSRNLLGLYQQSDEIRRSRNAVVVEGNFDMISLVVHGCKNVVAPLGTALTTSQIRLLRKHADRAVLLFDGDMAGKKAAFRTAPLFLAEQLPARVALLPAGHDPDTYVQEKGLPELNVLLDQAKELPEFVVDELINEYGLTYEGKSRIAEEIKPLIDAAPSDLQRSVIIAHFSEKLGVEPGQLENIFQSRTTAPVEKMSRSMLPREKNRSSTLLNAAQKRLVEFMIMNPHHFEKLEEKNIRSALQGGMGEILFLQVKMMLASGKEVQPEEVLSALPEGPERSFVADVLLNAPQVGGVEEPTQQEKQELVELLDWLDTQEMRAVSNDLSRKIEEAQQNNDFQRLTELLQEKQNIEIQLRKLRENSG